VRLCAGSGRGSSEARGQNHTACVGCGACVSAANGVITARPTMTPLAARIRERVQAGVIPYRLHRAQGRANLVLPCLSRLTGPLSWSRSGWGSRVELLDPVARPVGSQGRSQWQKVASCRACANRRAGDGSGNSLRVPIGWAQEARPPGKPVNSRRDMFGPLPGVGR
jgi:hypothetical protein